MATTSSRPSARDRLLAAADELFYAEGINTVGIDRVIERAGVAKASLYSTFGSKDALVRAYLEARHAAWKARLDAGFEAQPCDPRAHVLAVFDALAEWFTEPGFCGCAFINAAAEATPGSQTAAATDEFRRWLGALFLDLTRQTAAEHPERLARQLVLLYDGASVSAQMAPDADVGAAARAAAVTLLDTAGVA